MMCLYERFNALLIRCGCIIIISRNTRMLKTHQTVAEGSYEKSGRIIAIRIINTRHQ